MKTIKGIDLWTEKFENQPDLTQGAFIDGWISGGGDLAPYSKYKIVRNCNCIITTNTQSLPISNKHNAIIFYKSETPVRLVVLEKGSNIEKLEKEALSQIIGKEKLSTIFKRQNIQREEINLNQSLKKIYSTGTILMLMSDLVIALDYLKVF